MASEPWFSTHRNQWLMRYRDSPGGKWLTVGLGKHPTKVNKDRPPKKAPIEILDRANEFKEIEYRALTGIGPVPQRARPLGQYLDAYLAAYANGHASGSILLCKRYIDNFKAFAESIGIATVQAVTKAVCRDYLESRASTVSPNGLQTEKGYLSGVWARAVTDGIVAVNPWFRLPVPGKKSVAVPTFWTDTEVSRIVDAARDRGPWQADFIQLMFLTGMRLRAALYLEWSWIDWAENIVRIPPKEGFKGGYTHVMSPEARELLERRHITSSSNLCFPSPRGGGKIAHTTAESMVRRAVAKSKVPYGHSHDLRHTYARNLERAGVPISVIQRQIGHRSLSHTHRYATANENEIARWIGQGRPAKRKAKPSSVASDETSPDPATGPSDATD